MNTKKYLYAAVGAQVAIARAARGRIEELMSAMNENATSASTDLRGRIDGWAGEGEQFLGKVADTKTIDELTSKVDFDQVQTQVNKLRDQLEDIMGTWRANFRPESKPAEKMTAEKVTVETGASSTPNATKTTTTKTTTRKTAAKSSANPRAATTSAASKPAAKAAVSKPAAKKPAAKKAAAKKAVANTGAAKKPAASKPTAMSSTTGATTATPATKAS